MSHGIRLHIPGGRPCPTRPEVKVARGSSDGMTPSARGILEAMLRKPRMRRVVDRIHVPRSVRLPSFRRGEVGAKGSARNAEPAMRAADVIAAPVEPPDERALGDTLAKDPAMLDRRVESGPRLHRRGRDTREFVAAFALP